MKPIFYEGLNERSRADVAESQYADLIASDALRWNRLDITITTEYIRSNQSVISPRG